MSGQRLRVLTANIWARGGPYRRREPLLREQIARVAPDLVALQEVEDGPGHSNQAEELFGALGYHVVYEPRVGHLVGDPGNAVLSRFPVPGSRFPVHGSRFTVPGSRFPVLDRRLLVLPHGGPCLAVRVQTPSGPLWFCSAAPMGVWPHQEVQREDEAVALELAELASGDDLPPVLAGDFDAVPEAASIRFLAGRQSLRGRSTGWIDAWAVAGDGSPGFTWTSENPYVAPFAAAIFAEPTHARRIDYVFVGSPFRWRPRIVIRSCAIGLDRPLAGPPSDHYGVLAELEVDADVVGDGRGLESLEALEGRLWPETDTG